MVNKKVIGLVAFIAVLFLISAMPSQMGRELLSPSTINDGQDSPLIEEYKEAADGDNWLTGWQYRIQIHFVESGAAGTNYPIDFVINYDAAGDSHEINCSSNCQTDFDDIRFTSRDGDTLLDYWLEEKTDSDDATFWVEVDCDLSTGQVAVIYIYWGNAGASSLSNIDNTFIWADDFETGDLSKWSDAGAAWSAQTTIKKYGSYAAKGVGQAAGRALTEDLADITTSVAIMMDVYVSAATSFWLSQYHYTTAPDSTSIYASAWCGHEAGDQIKTYNGVAYVQWGSFSYAGTTWYHELVGYDFDNGDMYYYQDGSGASNNPQDLKNANGNLATNIAKLTSLSAASGSTAYIDNYIVRKWIYGEPIVSWALVDDGDIENGGDITFNSFSCTNLDDSDKLYAYYKTYNFSVSLSLPAGGTAFSTVYLYLWNSTGTTPIWSVVYTESTNVFSMDAGIAYIVDVATTDNTYSKSGDTLVVYFGIIVKWIHFDMTDSRFKIYATTDFSTSETEWYNSTGYDFETRLDFASFELTDHSGVADRGNYDTQNSVHAEGVIEYYNTLSNKFPPNDTMDIWVNCSDIGVSKAVAYTVDGAFHITHDSDDEVGLDTYHFKIVEEGGGSGGTDLCHASHSDTYIADRIIVMAYQTNSTSNRENVGTYALVTVWLQYDYDDTNVTDGTATINGDTFTHLTDGNWTATLTNASVGISNWNVVSCSSNEHGITYVSQNGKSQSFIWDRVNLTLSSNLYWTVIGYNTTLSATGIYEYDSTVWTGTITWDNQFPSESTAGSYNYDETAITSITSNEETSITAFRLATNGDVDVIFDNIAISSAAYSWIQYSEYQVWLSWTASNIYWEVNGTADNVKLQSQINGTNDDWAYVFDNNTGGMIIGSFDTTWYYVNVTIYAQIGSYNWSVWTQILYVDVLHSIHFTTLNIYETDNYVIYTFYLQSENTTFVSVWDNITGTPFLVDNQTAQGSHRISLNITTGTHSLIFLFNQSASLDWAQQTCNPSLTDDWWAWAYYDYTVSGTTYEAHIIILDSLGTLIQFDQFEVYINGTRQFYNVLDVTEGYGYNVTVVSRFGETLNTTDFAAAREFVVWIQLYSLKFMSWYEGFVQLNITHNSQTIEEVIMPLEIVNYYLYGGSYTYGIDYLNGTTISTGISLTASTGVVITGYSITDVIELSDDIITMITSINVTIVDTNNQVISIYLNLTNINTTLYSQTVSILTDIDNYNTTIYYQTLSILGNLSNVNTTLYAQTVSILSDISNVNTTLYAQSVSILSDILNVNTTLYNQAVNLLSNLTNVNTTLYAQTVSLLSNITNVNSTIYGQLVTVLSNIANMNTTLYTQTVTILANISNVNSTIYAQLITELAAINNLNTTIYTQVITQLLSIYQNSLNKGGDNDVVELATYNLLAYGLFGIFVMMFVIQIPVVQDLIPGKKSRRKKEKQPEHLAPYSYKDGENDQYDRRRRE